MDSIRLHNVISQNIQSIRKQFKMDQYEFAKHFGVKTSTVGSWENGRSIPNFPLLIEICEFGHMSLDKMVGREDNEFIDIGGLTSEDKLIIQIVINSMRYARGSQEDR